MFSHIFVSKISPPLPIFLSFCLLFYKITSYVAELSWKVSLFSSFSSSSNYCILSIDYFLVLRYSVTLPHWLYKVCSEIYRCVCLMKNIFTECNCFFSYIQMQVFVYGSYGDCLSVYLYIWLINCFFVYLLVWLFVCLLDCQLACLLCYI